jgi:DNA-binding beta-propeller fold protein YncE
VRAYRLPTLAEIPNAVRGRLPPVARVVGLDAESQVLFVTTATGELLSLDLETGRVDTVAASVVVTVLGPDQTLFVVDAKRRVTSVARRARLTWPQPLSVAPRELFGAADQRLIAVVPGDSTRPSTLRLITVAADQPPATRVLPFTGDVAATRWGDLVAVASDSGVLLVDPQARREAAFVPLADHPRALAFSPSGHRVYVARRTGAGLAVIDRYERAEVDGVALPTPAATVRLDPLGRWLLARPSIGDSVWVIDLPIKTLVGTVATSWDRDLPAIAPDGSLLVGQENDVVAYRADSVVKETGRVRGGDADLWTFTPGRSSGFRGTLADAQTSSPAPDSAGGAVAGTPGPEGPLYVQVSTSQNEAWSAQMAQQLSRAGLAARVLPPKGLDDGFRVVLGPYESRDQAEAIGRKLGRPFWIYQPSP